MSWTSLYSFPIKGNMPSAICCISFRWTLLQKMSRAPSLTGRFCTYNIMKVENWFRSWVFQCPGSLEDAQQEFPLGVSIGKTRNCHQCHLPPRLVVDNSVSGLNARCWIPEHSTLPSAEDLLRCWPVREHSDDLGGFSLDIKAAHKTNRSPS